MGRLSTLSLTRTVAHGSGFQRSLAFLVAANSLGALTPPIINLGGITQYAVDPAFSVFVLDSGTPSSFDLVTPSPSPLPPLPPALPAFSCVDTLTFDTLRNRVLSGSFGGVGYLHAFDTATSSWTVVTSFNSADPAARAYDPANDALGCINHTFGSDALDLVRRDPSTGAVLSTHPLALETWGFIIDSFQLYMLGSNWIMIGPAKDVLGLAVRHTFIIDPTTADLVFAGFRAS